MNGFLAFLEGLKFDKPVAGMQSHPEVVGATFGVEIEFITAAIPPKHMTPLQLFYGLRGSDFEQEFYNRENTDDENAFLDYVSGNKREAMNALWEIIGTWRWGPPEEYEEKYTDAVIGYWGMEIIKIVREAGFKIVADNQASGTRWAVGGDGVDTEYRLPIIELRSGILNQSDVPQLLEVFEGLSAMVKSNKELMARGNTGFHIHVGNTRTGGDMFSRLSAAADVDEDWIWDVSAPHDRAFERHAALNRPYDGRGTHDAIFEALWLLWNAGGTQGMVSSPGNPLVVGGREFTNYMRGNLGRNAGVNTTTEHPTVEYRYFSSMLVVEDPKKAIDAINYFIQNTAQRTSKDRIVFESGGRRFVLTRMPHGAVRIDYVPLDETPRIPRAGRKTDDMINDDESNPGWRKLHQPFLPWIKQKMDRTQAGAGQFKQWLQQHGTRWDKR